MNRPVEQKVVEVQHGCRQGSHLAVLAQRSLCFLAVAAASSGRSVHFAHTERCARSVAVPRLRTRTV